MSYDNTVALGASTWRHVAFIERPVPLSNQIADGFSWLFSSDVCKHCARAGCLESCPTGAIVRTEFDTVFVQSDVCNGCGYCIVNCPFGVIDRREDDGRAWKCTLCYDRLKEDLTPACAKACPTESIQFGDLDELRRRAHKRVDRLHELGMPEAYLYGADKASQQGTEGLNAFFLLVDKPEVYNLPPDPVVPTKNVGASWISMGLAALGVAAVALGSVLAAREGNSRG
jgi:formate dehydrogenase iron-sulfur subunit